MNYYENVAKLLGVELGEKFKLRNDASNYCDDTFYFSEYGLKDIDVLYSCNELLNEILTGKAEIVKLPWKPKFGEQYWNYSARTNQACCSMFEEFVEDYAIWKSGNCFRTEEEAKTKGKEIMEKLVKEYEEA